MNIAEIIKELRYPLPLSALFSILFFLTLWFILEGLKHGLFKGLEIWLKKNPKEKLSEHPFFSFMDNMIYKLESHTYCDFFDEGRKVINTDYMLLKFKAHRTGILKMTNELEKLNDLNRLEKLTENELRNIINQNLLENQQKIEDWVNSHHSDDYDSLSTYHKKFNEFHAGRVSFMQGVISMVCQTNMYQSNYAKIVTILFNYLHAFEETMKEGKHTLESLNGELSGKKYKGITIGEYHKIKE